MAPASFEVGAFLCLYTFAELPNDKYAFSFSKDDSRVLNGLFSFVNEIFCFV